MRRSLVPGQKALAAGTEADTGKWSLIIRHARQQNCASRPQAFNLPALNEQPLAKYSQQTYDLLQ